MLLVLIKNLAYKKTGAKSASLQEKKWILSRLEDSRV